MTEHKIVTGSSCADCIHNAVCHYQKEFLRICDSVNSCRTVGEDASGREVLKPITKFEMLKEIHVACKYFRKEAPIPKLVPRDLVDIYYDNDPSYTSTGGRYDSYTDTFITNYDSNNQ